MTLGFFFRARAYRNRRRIRIGEEIILVSVYSIVIFRHAIDISVVLELDRREFFAPRDTFEPAAENAIEYFSHLCASVCVRVYSLRGYQIFPFLKMNREREGRAR